MSKQRIIIIVFALIGILGTFLPWVKFSAGGILCGTAGDGWITLGLYSLVIVFSLITKDFKSDLSIGWLIGVIIPSLLSSLIGIWKIFTFRDMGQEKFLYVKKMSDIFTVQYGIYVVSAAGVLIVVFAFCFKSKKEKTVSQD